MLEFDHTARFDAVPDLVIRVTELGREPINLERTVDVRNPTSDLPPGPDIADEAGHVGFVPILLQKSVAADGRSTISL